MEHETKNYADGATATGTVPLPDLSPAEQASDHQCCGKCEKPDAMPAVHAAIDPEQPTATPEQYMAAISDLSNRLQTADALITILLLKAGGEVVLTADDCDGVLSYKITSDPAPDGSGFTFRAVLVQ